LGSDSFYTFRESTYTVGSTGNINCTMARNIHSTYHHHSGLLWVQDKLTFWYLWCIFFVFTIPQRMRRDIDTGRALSTVIMLSSLRKGIPVIQFPDFVHS